MVFFVKENDLGIVAAQLGPQGAGAFNAAETATDNDNALLGHGRWGEVGFSGDGLQYVACVRGGIVAEGPAPREEGQRKIDPVRSDNLAAAASLRTTIYR